MAKNILQDIKPLTSNGRRMDRSVERIAPLPKKEVEQYIDVEETPEETPARVQYSTPSTPRRRGRGIIWGVVIIALVVLFVAVSYAFEGATVTVVPKQNSVTLENAFTAQKDAEASDLAFEVIALSGEESKTFTGTEKREASDKATGKVIIYNEFSTTAQPLLIETRLGTKDGKIYKTDKAVKVPGYTKKGNEIIPGSIEVGVHADVAGEEYNISPSDFSVVGFKGTPKATKIYARSKAAISGGAKGERYTLSTEEKTKAQTELVAALKDKLTKQAVSQIPEGFVYYDGGMVFDVDQSGLSFEGDSSTVTGTAKGKISIILFDEAKLTTAVTKATVSQYDGLPMTIPELRDLSFVFKSAPDLDLTTAKTVSFGLNGDAHVIAIIDKEALATELSGKNKKDQAQAVFTAWKGIDTAEIVVRPFWKGTLPSKPQDIKVIVSPN